MNSFVIDSSVYIARFNENDPFHNETKRFFNDAKTLFETSQLFMPSIVLFELNNYFGRLNNKNARKIYQSFELGLLEDTRFTIDILDLEFLVAFRKFSLKIRLKTADSIIACSAAIHNAVFISWDKKLLLRAKPFVTAATPTELCRYRTPHERSEWGVALA